MDWTGIVNLTNLLAGGAAAISGLMLLKAGYTYVTAGGNPRKQGEAYSSAENVIKGLILILSVTALSNVLVGNLKLG